MNPLKFLLLIALTGSIAACQSHVFLKKTELSSDHTYIHFEQMTKSYVVKGEVGGEQMSLTKILAFAGERYQIEVTPKLENLRLYVTGNGIEVEDLGPLKKGILVGETFETIIEISLTAHPDSANYTLTVTKR